MIFTIAYFVIAFVAMIIASRVVLGLMTEGEPRYADGDKYALAVVAGFFAGLLWPVSLLVLLVTRLAFPHLFSKETTR